MLIKTLREIFRKDLEKLRIEIELYNDEKRLWFIERNIANSAGNLCLHLTGNLRFYIGTELGKTGYVRNREAEFSLKNVPRSELLSQIDETIRVVDGTLKNLKKNRLKEEYPIKVFETRTTTEYFLVHLAAHLAYHLGQINYHRRLLDS